MNTNLTVLLMGPPNVGKSVIFNRLTGMNVSCANYAGTTVEFSAGPAKLNTTTEACLIDVPGTYTLEATNDAEKVAVEMLAGNHIPGKGAGHCSSNPHCSIQNNLDQGPAAVLCVLDAGNLESSLYLLLQILEYNLPVVAALNRVDLAGEKGESIDHKYLARELGIPIIPTVAVAGEGFAEIKTSVTRALEVGDKRIASSGPGAKASSLWSRAEELAKGSKRPPSGIISAGASRRRSLGNLLLRPWPGLPLAVLMLTVVLAIIVGLGMGMRKFLLLPLFRGLIIPQVVWVVEKLIPSGMVQNVLIGEYGFLVKGLEWPFTLVMPYVLSFYFALSLLEDSGYLPRLGGLLDGLLNRAGMRGSSIIPLLLGYGCGIPAIMATRALESRKERLMISTMVCLAIPCISQSGAFIALLSEKSIALVPALFLLSFLVMGSAGLLLDRLLKGERLPIIMEIPELLTPRLDIIGKKIWTRLKLYVTDGALPMVGAVAIAAVLFESGGMLYLGNALKPLVTGWLGLPQEAAVPLVLGIMRREMTVLPLLEMDLTSLQLFVGATVGLFYVPCIAIVATMAREFSITIALGILLFTSTLAFLAGGILYRLGNFILSIPPLAG